MNTPRPWFKAKSYGWGWGAACTWQGWATYGGYVLSMAAVVAEFPPGRAPISFAAGAGVLTAALIGICLSKGEKPGWRWG